MKKQLPRGTCPDCGKECALRFPGVVRVHQTGWGQSDSPPCKGSGKHPIEQQQMETNR